MPATLDFDVPFALTTPAGSLSLNTPDLLGAGEGGKILVLPTSRMYAPLRVTIDEVPQGDGAIPHPVLTSGYRVKLDVEFWLTEEQFACDRELTLLCDLYMRHLSSLRRGEGRLAWNPLGDDIAERMVDDLWWVEDVQETDDGGIRGLTAGLASAFPYAQDLTEITTTLLDVVPATVTNNGSAQFWPVLKVYGPTSGFTIQNVSSFDDDGNTRLLTYDSALPGAVPIAAAHYVEFDFFRNTAYLDGDGPSRKAGIDLTVSDFFPLEVGDNDLIIDGADADLLWQAAWV